jgi:hypothetical protein
MTSEQPKQPKSTEQRKQDEKHPSVLEDKEEFTKDPLPHMGDKPQPDKGQPQKS